MTDIIFFAIIALILVYKLYSILGKKSNDDMDEKMSRSSFGKNTKRIDITCEIQKNKLASEKDEKESIKKNSRFKSKDPDKAIKDDAKKNLEQLKAKIKDFDISAFLGECGELFANILEGYDSGKITKIKKLVSQKLYKDLEKSLEQHKNENLIERIILVKIENIEIENIEITNIANKSDLVQIKILISSQQIHYITNEEGVVDKKSRGKQHIINDVVEIWSIEKTLDFPVESKEKEIDKEKANDWIVSNVENLS